MHMGNQHVSLCDMQWWQVEELEKIKKNKKKSFLLKWQQQFKKKFSNVECFSKEWNVSNISNLKHVICLQEQYVTQWINGKSNCSTIEIFWLDVMRTLWIQCSYRKSNKMKQNKSFVPLPWWLCAQTILYLLKIQTPVWLQRIQRERAMKLILISWSVNKTIKQGQSDASWSEYLTLQLQWIKA